MKVKIEVKQNNHFVFEVNENSGSKMPGVKEIEFLRNSGALHEEMPIEEISSYFRHLGDEYKKQPIFRLPSVHKASLKAGMFHQISQKLKTQNLKKIMKDFEKHIEFVFYDSNVFMTMDDFDIIRNMWMEYLRNEPERKRERIGTQSKRMRI